MDSGDVPAIISAFALLVGGVFTGIIGLGQRRTRIDRETLDELDDYQRWRPRVKRAVVLLRARISETVGAVEPDGIDDLMEFPPPRPRHAREVTSDDA